MRRLIVLLAFVFFSAAGLLAQPVRKLKCDSINYEQLDWKGWHALIELAKADPELSLDMKAMEDQFNRIMDEIDATFHSGSIPVHSEQKEAVLILGCLNPVLEETMGE